MPLNQTTDSPNRVPGSGELIIVPTFNERTNILTLLKAVLAATDSGVHVLVCDDNSPDGTADLVREAQAGESRIHLLVRKSKRGLGPAYLDAFHWALDQGYRALVQMDADFSHRPEDLGKILAALPQADFVMGSRWVPGGRTINWGIGRQVISRTGSRYARAILGYPITDYTGGFNAWTRRVLESIDLSSIKSNGYSFQIELKYCALQLGFKHIEVPIVFEDRRAGQSKMSLKIILEAIYRVWLLKFSGT